MILHYNIHTLSSLHTGDRIIYDSSNNATFTQSVPTMFHSGSYMILRSGFSIATDADGSMSFDMQKYTDETQWLTCSHCHGNRKTIYHIYKLKERTSRLDRDMTGIKKPLSVTGALKSCYITPEYGRCEDNNVGVNKLALLQT